MTVSYKFDISSSKKIIVYLRLDISSSRKEVIPLRRQFVKRHGVTNGIATSLTCVRYARGTFYLNCKSGHAVGIFAKKAQVPLGFSKRENEKSKESFSLKSCELSFKETIRISFQL